MGDTKNQFECVNMNEYRLVLRMQRGKMSSMGVLSFLLNSDGESSPNGPRRDICVEDTVIKFLK